MKEFPRLVDDPELGAHVRAARESAISEERLARNRRELDGRLAVLAVTGTVGVAASAKAATWVKMVVAFFALGTVATVATTVVRRDTASTQGVVVDEAARATDAPMALEPAPPVAPPNPRPAPVRPRDPPRRAEVPAPPLAPTPAPSPVPSEPPERGDQLREQLATFEAARQALRAGAAERAIGMVDALLRDHPSTVLRPEAVALRAEALAASDRVDEAIVAVGDLIAKEANAARRGEWLRVLGDLERRRGDCRRASELYNQALGLPLPGPTAEAARRGLRACDH